MYRGLAPHKITPMPGVHICIHKDARKLAPVMQSVFVLALPAKDRKGPVIKTKQDVLNVLYQHQSQLRALGVRRIGLFGSFVLGEQRPDSDIDLLVDFELSFPFGWMVPLTPKKNDIFTIL